MISNNAQFALRAFKSQPYSLHFRLSNRRQKLEMIPTGNLHLDNKTYSSAYRSE